LWGPKEYECRDEQKRTSTINANAETTTSRRRRRDGRRNGRRRRGRKSRPA